MAASSIAFSGSNRSSGHHPGNSMRVWPMLFVALAAALLVSAMPVWAASSWQVVATSGEVTRYQRDTNAWIEVASGTELSLPFTIKTGDGSTAELQRDGDRVSLAAGSVLDFPEEQSDENGLLTRMIEKAGFILFRIEPGKRRTVTVETPFLVSVVKGTTFTVQASDTRAVVNLVVGQLEINAVDIDHTVMITTGEVALLSAGDKKITVISPEQAASDGDGGGGGGPAVDAVVADVAASVDALTPRVVVITPEPPIVIDVPKGPEVPDVPDVPDVPEDPCAGGGGGKACAPGQIR